MLDLGNSRISTSLCENLSHGWPVEGFDVPVQQDVTPLVGGRKDRERKESGRGKLTTFQFATNQQSIFISYSQNEQM